jgi:hypothetical protein
VVANADYGDNPNFLGGLEQRHERYVVADYRDFAVVGRRRQVEPSRRAEAMQGALPGSAWRTLRWREGGKGPPLRGRFAALRCWRVTSDGRRHLGWLIGEREATGQERRRKYYWSNFGPSMSLIQMVEYTPADATGWSGSTRRPRGSWAGLSTRAGWGRGSIGMR